MTFIYGLIPPMAGRNRVKASENLGAIAVAPVAPAVTSLCTYSLVDFNYGNVNLIYVLFISHFLKVHIGIKT